MSNHEYTIGKDQSPHVCEYCGRPFSQQEWLDLHRGLEHPNELSEEHISAFQTAYEAEEGELGRFRLRALGVLILLYFCLLMVYALV
jgi:hypothetical protein